MAAAAAATPVTMWLEFRKGGEGSGSALCCGEGGWIREIKRQHRQGESPPRQTDSFISSLPAN